MEGSLLKLIALIVPVHGWAPAFAGVTNFSVLQARKGQEMAMKMILTGDVNLMNVTDPAVPFSLFETEFRAADMIFCNLECCLYRPPSGHSMEHEGFYADPLLAGGGSYRQALTRA